MPKITSLRITPGHQVYCFDEQNKPIKKLQISLLQLFAKHAADNGYDADGLICETSPMDRWRIVSRDGKWEVERA